MVEFLMEREKLMLMPMLVFMAIVPMVLVLSQPQPLSAVVFLSGHVTKFLLIDQGKLQRLCKTVTDIKVIKDCTDTVSTTCTQQSV